MNIQATIYTHSIADKIVVKQYLRSPRYKALRDVTGAELKMSHCSLNNIVAGMYDCVIAPGNSLGIMTGGFDQGLIDICGPQLQDRVTEAIALHHRGELNVGAAHLVPTGYYELPYCAYAPTMRTPVELPYDTDVPYLATRAGLLAYMCQSADQGNTPHEILIPLMGVGTGGLPVFFVLNQIHLALGSINPNNKFLPVTLERGATLTLAIKDRDWIE